MVSTGAKLTVITHEAPEARLAGQLLVWLNGAPVAEMLKGEGIDAMFVTVMVVLEDAPAAAVSDAAAVLKLSACASPVPLNATEAVKGALVSVKSTDPVSNPFTVGV